MSLYQHTVSRSLLSWKKQTDNRRRKKIYLPRGVPSKKLAWWLPSRMVSASLVRAHILSQWTCLPTFHSHFIIMKGIARLELNCTISLRPRLYQLTAIWSSMKVVRARYAIVSVFITLQQDQLCTPLCSMSKCLLKRLWDWAVIRSPKWMSPWQRAFTWLARWPTFWSTSTILRAQVPARCTSRKSLQLDWWMESV